MDLLFLPVALGILWNLKFCREGFFDDALSPAKTRPFRGILAVLVLLHHLYQQTRSGVLYFFFDNVGIVCVGLFFFFSGFGVMKSHLAKPGYSRSLLTKRIPGVLIPFLVLFVLYLGLYALLGTPVSRWDALLSLVDGDPIVAFGWYTECILLFYLFFYLCTRRFGQDRKMLVLGSLLLSVLWVYAARGMNFPAHWYDMAIAFPAGIFWAAWGDDLLPKLRQRYVLWLIVSLVVFLGCFAGSLALSVTRTVVPLYWAAGCGLLLFVVLLLQKVSFGNPLLNFLGDHAFEIYGLHGAFLLLYRSDLVYLSSDLLWGTAILLSTLPAAWLLRRITKR